METRVEETSAAYRLSFKEIVYLAGSLTKAKEIYGLQAQPLQAEDWSGVKKGLLDKQILWEKEGGLRLCSDILGEIIRAVAQPKVLAALRPQARGGRLTRFYVRGTFTAAVDNDQYAEDFYLLRAFANSGDVQKLIRETVDLGDYEPGNEDVTLKTETLEALMTAVKEADGDAAYNLLLENGMAPEGAKDFYGALLGKNELLSYVVYAFDPAYAGSRRAARESILYGGRVHLWELRIAGGEARALTASREAVLEDLRVVSRLMDFV